MELKFMHDRDLYYLLQRVGPRPHSGMQIAKEWLRRYPIDHNVSHHGMQKHATELSIAIVKGDIVCPMDLLKRLVENGPWKLIQYDAITKLVCYYCECLDDQNHKDDCIYKLAEELLND